MLSRFLNMRCKRRFVLNFGFERTRGSVVGSPLPRARHSTYSFNAKDSLEANTVSNRTR